MHVKFICPVCYLKLFCVKEMQNCIFAKIIHKSLFEVKERLCCLTNLTRNNLVVSSNALVFDVYIENDLIPDEDKKETRNISKVRKFSSSHWQSNMLKKGTSPHL